MPRPVPGSGLNTWGTTLNADLDGIEAGTSVNGTGSPEGAVTAAVGKTYRDTAATNGAVLWVKATGAGNTGWRVTYGDTGWRILNDYFWAGLGLRFVGSSPRIVMRRQGYHVALVMEYVESAAGDTGTTSWPAGFALSVTPIVGEVRRSNGTNGWPVQMTTTGISRMAYIDATFVYFSHAWVTDDSWPTTLPGTAL